MALWKKLFGSDESDRVDYYVEGLELLQAGKFQEALTSFRLALRESPGDPVVLQQIAITYTRIGMLDDAAKTYRHVLKGDATAPGAHYGLAFLHLRAGDREAGAHHLRTFLQYAPDSADAREHVAHARATLAQLNGGGEPSAAAPADLGGDVGS